MVAANNNDNEREKTETIRKEDLLRVDFSLRREVFFVVIGAIIGAIAMIAPKTIFEFQMGLPYYLTWIVFGHIASVYSSASASIFAGMVLHVVTAISIGILAGIFLYKTNILNVSKPSNGLLYGIITGIVVFTAFFIPVNQFLLAPEIIRTVSDIDRSISQDEAAEMVQGDQLMIIVIGSIVMHLVFGITLGAVSSFLEMRFGAKYRCPGCEISFSRIDSLIKHIELVHGSSPIRQKRLLVLGGGFAGIEVLKRLQSTFEDDVEVHITLISRDNFFLFTPLLHEVSSGMIETRHISTPVREFCKRAKFYEADVESIDLESKRVIIRHAAGLEEELHEGQQQFAEFSSSKNSGHTHILEYDYLIIALGSKTKFFGLKDIEQNAFTMKELDDAIILRNHVINLLETADFEHEDKELRKSLLSFVVVGGGFSGVETVGELNDFVRSLTKQYYYNIDAKRDVRVVLISSGNRLLHEMDKEFGEFALEKLQENGIEVMLDTHAESATPNSVTLDNGMTIPTRTLIWSAGTTTEKLVRELPCEHDKSGRILVDSYMRVKGYEDTVFALGDCSAVPEPRNSDKDGKIYPPTAQHALREGRVAAQNVAALINNKKMGAFKYNTKGMMATVGKRNGVAIIFGFKLHGFMAWWLWRTFYLANLPTVEKKLRVMIDWTVDLLFKRDVTRIRIFGKENEVSIDRQRIERAETL
jgi:NADH dehydrogenase FAD-containing subunit